MNEEAPKRVARRINVSSTTTPRRVLDKPVPSNRPARRVQPETYQVDDHLRLAPPRGESPEFLRVLAPDGSQFAFPNKRGFFKLWLAQAGTWVYRWDEGPETAIEVGRRTRPVESEGRAPVLPAMSVVRRPRF